MCKKNRTNRTMVSLNFLIDDAAVREVGHEVLKKKEEVKCVKCSGQSSNFPDPDSKLFVMKSDVS